MDTLGGLGVTGRGSLPAISSLLFVAVESAIQRVDADEAWWLCDLLLDGRDQRLMVGDDVERHRCRLW
jgi:hypothetical protein